MGGFMAGILIGGAIGGCMGIVLMCCLFAAKTTDPHSIPRKENVWGDNTSGVDMP